MNSLKAQSRVLRHPRLMAGLGLAIGMALTVTASLWQVRENDRVARKRFASIAGDVVSRLSARLATYEYGLLGARGIVLDSGPETANRQRFERYATSRDIDREFPGARGTGVIWRVAPADELAFVAAAQRDGAPDFSVRQIAPHAGDRYVVTYVEPLGRNRQAIGLDIGSEPVRRGAADAASRSGRTTITAPITFAVPGAAPHRSFLLLLPIYRPGSPVANEAQRTAATQGWVFAPLQIDHVLAESALTSHQFSLTLLDRADGARPFYTTAEADEPAANGVAHTAALEIYGRTWNAAFSARPAFLSELNLVDPRLVLTIGTLLSVLLTGLLHALSQGVRREMAVRAEQARRAAIIDSSSDAIIGESLDGLVTDWNAGAERMFGHRAADTLGKPLIGLLLPAGREAEDTEIRAAIARGEAVPAFDTVRKHRDGSLIDVSVAASPILGFDGSSIGFAKTLRDISSARRTEREIRELNNDLERRVDERTQLLETARHDLQTILDAMPSVIGYWDANLINRVANRAHADWFGSGPEAIRGRHLEALIGSRMFELNRSYIEATLRGVPQSFERSYPLPEGRGIRHALVHYLPDVVDGEVRGFYAMLHDVSELTRSREHLDSVLRENEALLSTIRMHAIFSVADRQGRIIEANDNFCDITGYGREELLGNNHRIVNSGVQDRAFWVAMWRTISSGKPWRGEVCNRAKDGSLYWVDSIIAPFVGADGKIEKYISIRTDITAAKMAEQKLRASEAFLDRVGETAGVGGWQLQLDPLSLTWSTQTYRIHEIEPGTPIDLEAGISFFAPEARETIRLAVETCIAQGTGYDLELPFITATGRPLWVRAVGRAQVNDGKVTHLLGTLQDVTAGKQAEQALQATNERFSIASDAAGIGVWELDAAKGSLAMSDWMYRLFRRPRLGDAEPLQEWVDTIHVDDRERIQRDLQSALGGGPAFDAEFRITWPDGEVRHMKAAARVAGGANGAPLHMTGVNIDITERKRAELELRAASSLLQTVLASASEISIIATDPLLNVTVFNAGAERLLGYEAGEIVGHTTPVLIHDASELTARAQELTDQLGRPIEGGGVFTEPSTLGQPREWTYIRKDGTRVLVSLIVTAMRAPDGSLFGYLGIAHDVTRRKQYEESLRQAMHKAKHASLAKSQFLANMSHEIRTPMNAVIGLTYLLAQTVLDREQGEFLNKIRIASKSLLVVINDVLDLSKIEAGELTLESAPFGLRSVLHELGDLMSVQADAKRIRFSIDAPRDLPSALMGDSTRLHQVLTNLVANAIKFTEHGAVTLVVRRLDRGDDARARLRFTVKDSGIGISPDMQAKLFAPFAQADTSTTRRFGGTGLGLSIVKRVVTLMGGDVGLEGKPGVGSEFWVEIAFGIAAPSEVAVPPMRAMTGQRNLPGVRVLVVDDSEINLEVARRILELEGAQVVMANNGQEAVERLQAHPDGFDVVLMDVQMPVLDGHEATRLIRGELGLIALPVIALTAGALTSEHQRAANSGMNDFVSKPFDAHGLVRTILRHVKPTLALPQRSAPSEPLAANDAWPDIEGIETEDVRARLCGDIDLFRSTLQRLLKEFGDLGSLEQAGDADALGALGSRMHKLRGSANMLGAKSIGQLAANAETACRAGEAAQAAQWTRKVSMQVERLQANSTAVLERLNARADALAESSDDIGVDPGVLDELIVLLNQQSMSALESFQQISPQLRHRLGADAYLRVREQIDNLQFQQAALALAPVRP